MGQFSWITQDTHESIRESFGCSSKRKLRAYLHDNKGNVWSEESYEGYGEFGGKDFYVLLAEMNGHKAADLESQVDTHQQMREIGIDLYFGDEPYVSPNLTRNEHWTWKNRSPEPCPNQGWADLSTIRC